MENYCVSTLSHIRIPILTLSRALLVGLSIDPFLKKLGVESPEKKKAAAGPSQERRQNSPQMNTDGTQIYQNLSAYL